MAEYGQYHLQPRTIARSGFTNWFYKRYRWDKSYKRGVKLEGSTVPARDFTKSKKTKTTGVLDTKDVQDFRKEIEKAVYDIINDAFGG